ncbi:hypothetical protein ABZ461_27225 [Actinacidiphila glaucinigra]|uniref:hypothetical protein n=1 Tax=Actinacidiphila glaucinigra TaxID=235986 RepID=UPI0033D735EC
MSANTKKLIVLAICGLTSTVLGLSVGVLFFAAGMSAIDSVKIGGAVLSASVAASIGAIALFKFEDDGPRRGPQSSTTQNQVDVSTA